MYLAIQTIILLLFLIWLFLLYENRNFNVSFYEDFTLYIIYSVCEKFSYRCMYFKILNKLRLNISMWWYYGFFIVKNNK